ncbi:MAG: 50S ribosomal protein L17 [Planctomycetota bacterium]
MRHRVAGKKLGRSCAHREAMTRNFMVSVIKHERVITTVEKAKAMRRRVEKMLTLGKEKSLHRYRRALSQLQDREAVAKLFGELGPRYADRPGGYTRLIRLAERRVGDGGSRAIFELVDNQVLARQLAQAAEGEDA